MTNYTRGESKPQYEKIVTDGLTYLEGFYGIVEYNIKDKKFLLTKFTRDKKPIKISLNRSEITILIDIIKNFK